MFKVQLLVPLAAVATLRLPHPPLLASPLPTCYGMAGDPKKGASRRLGSLAGDVGDAGPSLGAVLLIPELCTQPQHLQSAPDASRTVMLRAACSKFDEACCPRTLLACRMRSLSF